MKKRLAKMMYIMMTSVLIFSMVATNIVLVTADTEKATFDDLVSLYAEYKDKGNELSSFNEKEPFENLVNEIAGFINNPEDNSEDGERINEYYDKLLSFTEQIDAYLEEQALESAKSNLQNLIDQLTKLNEDLYLSNSWDEFQFAIEEAENALESDSIGVGEVNEAINALDNAYNALEKRADVTLLQEQYDVYNETEQGNYTDKSWNAFLDVMRDVRKFLNDDNAIEAVSQQEVDDRLANLQAVANALDVKGDISALVDLYEDYTKYVEEIYTTSTWEKFEKTLGEAEEMIGNFDENNTGQEKINEFYRNLQNAEKQLLKKGSKSNLEKQYYVYVDSKYVDEEETTEKYTKKSWAEFEKTLNKVAAFLEDEAALNDASQDDMNAWLKTLNDARIVLKERGNLGPLTERFDEASELNAANYTQRSWRAFSDVYAKVEHFLTDDSEDAERHNALRNDIDTRLSALNQAIAELVEKGDTAALQEAYNKYIQYKESDYTAVSWKPFAEILEDIRKFLDGEAADPNLTQDKVKKKIAELTKAHHELVKKGDPTKLRDLYEQYVNEEASDYTTSSWKPFAEVLKEMDLFLNSEIVLNEKTQDDVDAELKKLQVAIKLLEKRGDTEALKTLHERYANSIEGIYDESDENPIKQDSYTTSTWAVFATEVERIQNEFLSDDELLADSTQKDVNAQLKDLEAAFNQLAKRGNTEALEELHGFYLTSINADEDEEDETLIKRKHFTTSTWAIFTAEVDRIQAEYLDDEELLADSTQKDVDGQLTALQAAFNQLENRGDINELKNVYEDHLGLLDDEENYTRSSWAEVISSLEEALEATATYIDHANDADVAADISQREIDEEKAKLYDLANKLMLRGNIDALVSAYEERKQELEDEGKDEKYTTKSLNALEDELTRIAAFLADAELLADSTQADVDAEQESLEAVKLEERGQIKELQKVYDKAVKELDKNANKYRISAVKSLQEALDETFTKYLEGNDKHADASQKELDDATNNIEGLYEALKSEDNKRGDASALEKAYAKASAKNLDIYTKDTKENLEALLKEIGNFLTDGSKDDATQEQLNIMLEELDKVEGQLVRKGEISLVQNAYNKYNAYKAENYNPGSWSIFRNKMDEVEKFLEDPDARENADNEKVAEMRELMEAAVGQLEKAPVDFTEITEAYDRLTNEFSEEDIRKYITDEKEADKLIKEINDIHKFFNEDKEKATNANAEKHTERLLAIYDQLTQAKKASEDLVDLEKEHDKVTDSLSKEDKEKYEDELKEIEEYFKGNRGEITDEQTKKYLDRLKEIQEELKAEEKPGEGNKPGDSNTPGDDNNPDDSTQPGDGNKPGDGTQSGDGNKPGDGTQSGGGTTLGDGTTSSGETPTLRDTVDKITTDPIGTVKDARDKYVLPHTASDNYKYIVTGVLMIVEGLFLYGYFRFFSFIRTRFDLF